MGTATVRTLKGGPHDGLKLRLWEPLPEAFCYQRTSENGIYAPDAVYVLREVPQKNRTIKRYEYTESWAKEREDRGRANRARRLARLKRKILAHPI